MFAAMRRVYAALGDSPAAERITARQRTIWDEWTRKLPGNAYVERRRREIEASATSAAH
jgi:hypothetical protein